MYVATAVPIEPYCTRLWASPELGYVCLYILELVFS